MKKRPLGSLTGHQGVFFILLLRLLKSSTWRWDTRKKKKKKKGSAVYIKGQKVEREDGACLQAGGRKKGGAPISPLHKHSRVFVFLGFLKDFLLTGVCAPARPRDDMWMYSWDEQTHTHTQQHDPYAWKQMRERERGDSSSPSLPGLSPSVWNYRQLCSFFCSISK